MLDLNNLNFGLGSIPLLSNAKTRSICAENPNGEARGGARAEFGKGWKCRPCISLPPNSTTTLAEIDESGIIQHIWITNEPKIFRDTILRFYWDGETTPSVEVPLGDYFANGHCLFSTVNSLPICVNPKQAFNSYWPMPFRKGCKITIENQRNETINNFFYQITYSLCDVPENAAYFHIQWRRSMTTREYPEHVIVDSICGQGHYVGTYLAWTQLSNGWWGEGEIKFYMDGDKEYPTICGTGTEDYFGGAWGFYNEQGRESPYSTPFLGLPLVRHVENEVPKFGLYRWHIMDPVRFEKDLKVTIQALGWWPNGKYQPLTDDIASTAYWYQTEPHAPFPAMLPIEQRWPR